VERRKDTAFKSIFFYNRCRSEKEIRSAPNSAGFLIRHIADVELLFAKNVFGVADVQVHAKTVIAKKDTGEWSNLQELLQYQQMAFETLRKALRRKQKHPGNR
jgi:hypothetical protein